MRKNGFALAVSIWISAILVASTLFILSMYKKGVDNASELEDKINSYLMLDGAVDRFIFFAKTGVFEKNYIMNELEKFPEKLKFGDSNQTFGEGVFVNIVSADELISVYGSDTGKINHLLNYVLQNKKDYENVIKDWIDDDDLENLNGAEKNYYFLKHALYEPSNMQVLQHPEELFLIKGLDAISPALQKRIIEQFHFSRTSILNLYVIEPSEIQKYIFLEKFEEKILESLYKTDQDLYALKLQEVLLKKADIESTTVPTKGLVVSFISKSGNAISRRKVDIYLRNDYNLPYSIHYNFTKE